MTTAIAYASGKPHIGNTYEIVLADSIARFKRMEGYDVFFQTGTDEHGQKIELKAQDAGVTPQEYVDKAAVEIKRIWDLMNTSYDKFIRTTDPDHKKQVQKIFKKMYAKGDIYKGHYEGMYCTPCESFFTTSPLLQFQHKTHKALSLMYLPRFLSTTHSNGRTRRYLYTRIWYKTRHWTIIYISRMQELPMPVSPVQNHHPRPAMSPIAIVRS